ncbi:10466_t:CDS:1, partial [Diversispora eburnea]
LFEYSEENYIKALTTLEKEVTEQYSNENEEDFETAFEIQEIS